MIGTLTGKVKSGTTQEIKAGGKFTLRELFQTGGDSDALLGRGRPGG